MRRNLVNAVIIAAACSCAGCAGSSTTPDESRQEPGATQNAEHSQRAKLLGIAGKYKSYVKVDGRMRVAPAPCAAPDFFHPEHRLSRSDDEGTHGRKLYTLYALKCEPGPGSYVRQSRPNDALEPVTRQIIVKESWVAEESKRGEHALTDVVGPGDKRYKPGAKGPLFVMYQTDPQDPHADDGWVYGTLTPDGKTVTGVGRLENCMKCHEKAPHGRLFGLPEG
jgi:hypothetical protein